MMMECPTHPREVDVYQVPEVKGGPGAANEGSGPGLLLGRAVRGAHLLFSTGPIGSQPLFPLACHSIQMQGPTLSLR